MCTLVPRVTLVPMLQPLLVHLKAYANHNNYVGGPGYGNYHPTV